MKSLLNKLLQKFSSKTLRSRPVKRFLGLRQTSSRYGGMSERELQLRMEMIVIKSISDPKRSLFNYAQQLSGFGIVDQERFLKAIEYLYAENDELAYHFCCNGIPALKPLQEQDWEFWLQAIVEQYRKHGVKKAAAYIGNLDAYLKEISLPPHTVTLNEISPIIEKLIAAFGGRRLKIKPHDVAYTNTDTLFLPPVYANFENYNDNFFLYKAQASFLWAQTQFGTWQIDTKRLLYDYSNFKHALALFLILENLRIDACIERELPGIAKLMSKLGKQADKLPDKPLWHHAVTRLSQVDATAQSSLDLMETLLSEPLPQATLYQGVLKPEETLKTIHARLADDKETLREELTEYLATLKAGSQETDKWALEINAGTADRYEFKLSYDKQALEITPELQKIFESILQDLGEIPQEYLQTQQDNATEVEASPIDEAIDANGDVVMSLPEWDYSIQQYRPNWCKVFLRDCKMGDANATKNTLAKYHDIVKRLKQTFEALRESDIRLSRQYEGDDIYLDAVIEAYVDIHSNIPPQQAIYTKTRKQDRNIAVLFMVDMSGSTKGWINELEREALVLLCESLEIMGDRYAIYGFSSFTRKQCNIYPIKDFTESYDDAVRGRIDGLTPENYTRIGASIRFLRNLLLEIEAKTRIMITLSDGKPDDKDGYRGQHGIEDTRRALLETTYFGVHPYCITIDTQATEYLPYMYGNANFSVVNKVSELPFKVSDIYRKITS